MFKFIQSFFYSLSLVIILTIGLGFVTTLLYYIINGIQ